MAAENQNTQRKPAPDPLYPL